DHHLVSNADPEELIDNAHARGIDGYIDIISKHTADVIDYAEGEYDYISKSESPYLDANGDAFDPAEYAGTGEFPEMESSTSFPYTPVADEDITLSPYWLNDVSLYHNRGNSTWEDRKSVV